VLAVGTELAEPDLWIKEPLALGGPLIRIDIDPATLARDYNADVAIAADAGASLGALVAKLDAAKGNRHGFLGTDEITRLRHAERGKLTPLESKHVKVLDALRRALPEDGQVFTDMTQIAYTGYCFFPCRRPRSWFFPVGYGTLGFALPAAIGGQLAAPNRQTVALMGDGGFQFTQQELGTAVENRLPLAIVLWNNDSLAQIRDGMKARGIPTIGVDQWNPDFIALAKAYGCVTAEPRSLAEFESSLTTAFAGDRPTLIQLREDAAFLTSPQGGPSPKNGP